MTYSDSRADEERETWERKPPAKRPNWEKLGTRSPWAPDWNVVLRLSESPRNEEVLLSTQRQHEINKPEKETGDAAPPWLFRGPSAATTVDRLSHAMSPHTDLLNDVNSWRTKHGCPPLTYSGDALIKSALIVVRLSIPRSGSPEDQAVIYDMSDEEALKWHPMVERDGEEFSEAEVRYTYILLRVCAHARIAWPN